MLLVILHPLIGADEGGVGLVGMRRQGQVTLPSLGSLLRRLDAAAAPPGLDGGEPDHGQDVGGEGAGLALGFRKSPAPSLPTTAILHTLISAITRPNPPGSGSVAKPVIWAGGLTGPNRS